MIHGGLRTKLLQRKVYQDTWKKKMKINLYVNKRNPNRQKQNKKQAHGLAPLIVTTRSYVSCISSTIGQGPKNSSSEDNRLGFKVTTTAFPTEKSAFSTEAFAFPTEASDSRAHLES